MKISFVAGFGPIVRDPDQSRGFWQRDLGMTLEEAAPSYVTNDDLEGVRAFALWPLTHAAEATFGTDTWPADLPVPTTSHPLSPEGILVGIACTPWMHEPTTDGPITES